LKETIKYVVRHKCQRFELVKGMIIKIKKQDLGFNVYIEETKGVAEEPCFS